MSTRRAPVIRSVDDMLDISRARLWLPPPEGRQRIRREALVSQRDLARALGVHLSIICRWEQGVQEVSGRYILQYTEALKALQRETENARTARRDMEHRTVDRVGGSQRPASTCESAGEVRRTPRCLATLPGGRG